jgi:acyl-CoA synthetase (AMP-forming)/AMP-acid ligase II
VDPGWLGGPTPPLRLELHYGQRVVPCFVERPRSLHGLLAEAVAHNPGGEAVVCGDERLSWRDLDGRVGRLAAALARRGIGSGDRIAMLLGNGVPFVLTLFAAARLGAIAVPMSIRQQRPEIAFALADCGARALIHEPDLATRLPSTGEAPDLRIRVTAGACAGSEPLDTLLGEDGAPAAAPVDEDDVAVILYTSGTTGRPKGATLTGLGIVHSSLVYEHCMALSDRDRIIAAVPLAHVTGLIANVTAAVCAKATLVILPAFKARDFLTLAARERTTATVIAPAMYALFLLQPDFAAHDLSAWRIGAFGGAPHAARPRSSPWPALCPGCN